ncbi:2-keto-4-pentenoate hydratase [Sinorhizobium chiapasense]|uniref:2-keto-4-pentenoate hydratase n=1 Tax=Sinorhizobium chiapasense TaxID=501572 RepID=A0ABZ2BFP2_9HYPH
MNEHFHVAASHLVATREKRSINKVRLVGIDTLSDAYAIQERTRSLLKASIVGWKASLLTDGTLLSAPVLEGDSFQSGSTLPIEGRIEHGLECELAFLIDSALPPRPAHGYTQSHVAPHIGAVMPAFETLQSRLADAFQSHQTHLVADSLGNGGVVLGVPVYNWQERCVSDIGVTLNLDNRLVFSKRFSHPAGNPFDVVVALANHLAERQVVLKPDQFVITGSYTGAQKVQAGRQYKAVFDGFAPVTLRVAAEHEAEPPAR